VAFLSKIRGTFETLFQIGKGGPQVKDNAGSIDARNSADAAYVNVRGADPAIADDLVTKRYGDASYGAPSHVVSAGTTIAAGTTRYVPRYVEISAGITLEIGSNGDVEIG
jgi:hypothetical protein